MVKVDYNGRVYEAIRDGDAVILQDINDVSNFIIMSWKDYVVFVDRGGIGIFSNQMPVSVKIMPPVCGTDREKYKNAMPEHIAAALDLFYGVL